MIGALRKAWLSITEPRHMKAAYVAIYMATVAVGIVTLLYPPDTIAGEVGPILTEVWASMFILGGIVGAVSVLPGWWWLERLVAITPIVLGLVIYGVVVTILHVQGIDRGDSQLTQLGLILLAAALFLLRALVIREYSYEPRR